LPRLLLFIKRFLVAVALAAALLFLGDAVSVRFRAGHPRPGDPFESFTTSRILAIEEKNGKTEYQLDQLQPLQTLTCVHSLFPHFGYSPCWYLKPRLQQPIPMIIFLDSHTAPQQVAIPASTAKYSSDELILALRCLLNMFYNILDIIPVTN
jgi:hypothetical protein